MELNQTQLELFNWIKERESVRIKKENNEARPWTSDPILRDYKFCNVHRESDRVTKWIHDNWLKPYDHHPNIAFAMCLARHFNWPDTLEIIGFPLSWEPDTVREKLKAYREAGNKVYTGAYTVSTCGRRMDKVDYSIDVVLTPLYKNLQPPFVGDTLQDYWNHLLTHEGFASFMAGQVVADLKFIHPLNQAPDWDTWAPLGPGSIKGLNIFHGRAETKSISQEQGLKEMSVIRQLVMEHTGMNLAMHNLQNCLCEYSKYVRVKYFGGKTRSKYNGAGD